MNRPILLIWGSTFVICAAIILFFLWPSINGDIQTISETKKAKIQLTDASKMKATLAELNKNNELESLVTTAKNYIPEEAKSGDLILELTAIASQAAVNIDQLSLESSKAAKPVASNDTTETPQATPNAKATTAVTSEVGFQMTVSGTFETFEQFLKLTETSSRLIAISELSMTQAADKFTAQIKGKSFYKKASAFSGNIADITLSPTTITKLQNLKTYANPIDTKNEAGFGRTNPFENIQ